MAGTMNGWMATNCECRNLRLQCDGKRPDCSSCRKRVARCAYDDDAWPDLQRDFEALKLRYEELLRLFELLRTASNDTAQQALSRIRRGHSAKDVLQAAEAHNLPRSPWSLPMTGSILNLPEMPIEPEMVVAYPKVYTPFLPLDPPAVDLGLLGLEFASSMLPNKPAWEATHLVTGSTLPLSRSLGPAPLMRSGEGDGMTPSRENWTNSVFDERLGRLDISYWTKVSVSNDFAVGAINVYLTYEYPILGLFDADAFLDDLCEQKHLFCSSLLVNSLLAWMCVSSDETPIKITSQTKVSCINASNTLLIHWRVWRLVKVYYITLSNTFSPLSIAIPAKTPLPRALPDPSSARRHASGKRTAWRIRSRPFRRPYF